MKPAAPANPFEERRFDRYPGGWPAAAITVDGRQVACAVSNFSLAGALLDFASAPPVGQQFQMRIPEFEFEVTCFVKHRLGASLGVAFPVESETCATAPASSASENDIAPDHLRAAEQLLATLREIPEFHQCGFSAELGGTDCVVEVLREQQKRGAWTTGPDGLEWRSATSAAASTIQVPDVQEAARVTLMMVLNTMRVHRARAQHLARGKAPAANERLLPRRN